MSVKLETKMNWLLDTDHLQYMEQAYEKAVSPSAEQLQAFEASIATANEDSPRLLTSVAGVADIKIEGVLTKKPHWYARYYGGGNSSYDEITSALRHASADSSISKIQLSVDSPGGQVDGLFDLLDEIEATKKPVNAIVTNRAASAAYAIVSKADKIIASNKASSVGSVGIVSSFYVNDRVVDITSTNAPNKRPDVKTEEGKAVVRKQLDGLHSLFVDAIASGRNTTVDSVNEKFGKGSMLLAEDALQNGMIDSILSDNNKSSVAANSACDTKKIKMDINQLKADHADLFASVIQLGVQEEKDRVSAHLKMGDASGAMDVAIKAIEEGTGFSASIQAEYLAAGLNNRDKNDRIEDNVDASETATDADSQEEATEESASVIDMVNAKRGVIENG